VPVPEAEEVEVLRLTLPQPYDAERTLGRLASRLGDVTQRLFSHEWWKVRGQPRPHRLRVVFSAQEAAAFLPAGLVPPEPAALLRLLGLHAPWRDLAAAAAEDPVLQDLLTAAPGLYPFQYEDAFEALATTIFGQQVSLAVARGQRRAFVERFGDAWSDGLFAFPRPEAVLAQSSRLAELGLTRAKQRALLAAAEAAASGALDAVVRGEARLLDLSLPGVGPWTEAWFSLHALGDSDADLLLDLGVRRALASAHSLGREDRRALEEFHARHRPVRGWAALYYLHGWAQGLLPRSA
jgi:3-methyladenine DNA glycosylase/8-oxoguanine DNA glycosylase